MPPYPKPGETGGVLIRSILGFLKLQEFSYPIRDPALIAVSGGVDSMVLAHLLVRYGRKIVDPGKITLLHLDHGWRPEVAEVEREAVSELARSLEVGFLHQKLPPPGAQVKSGNLEEDARLKRLEVFDSLAGEGKPHRYVLTGHHADDVAETVLWRFLRGEFTGSGVGIKFQDYQCLRPLLPVSKELLYRYAKEEGVPYFEDSSNEDLGRFRAWARKKVFPMLEQHYPSVRHTLAEYSGLSFKAGGPHQAESAGHERENLLQAITGRPLNRAQRAAFGKMVREARPGSALSLPGGVQLKRMKNGWWIGDPGEDDQA
jgi:tRNA(Ile)-lysidine synthetase-like protein